jgi:Domain of unknown function (DUF4375)
MHRRLVALFLCALALAACGSSAPAEPAATATSTPDPAMPEFEAMLQQAAHPPKPLPGYKVRARDAAGLTGLDLWNAIVDPMIDPLDRYDGTAELHRRLNPEQYAVYALFAIDTDVEDGGLAEVYFNSSGVYAEDGVKLLSKIGASDHAVVLEQANRIVAPDGHVARDRAARQRRLGGLDDPRFAELEDRWDALPPLEDIVARYIRAHPHAFFV